MNRNAECDDVDLLYVTDRDPGFRRRKRGKGFSFHREDGLLLKDPKHLSRIRQLGIPPAYRDVWICTRPNGHIQATGMDAAGRKQYIYHPGWESWRAGKKYDNLLKFSAVLPRIRRRARQGLQAEVGSLDYMLAALVTLIDVTHIRVGNLRYAQLNKTFGATTLLKRHVSLDDDTIMIRFRAKGGKRIQSTLRHNRLHRILNDISDLPGRQLFVWIDEEGKCQPVDSGRLNAYLTESAGMEGVTAKLFRTWAGSVLAFSAALEAIEQQRAPTISEMVDAAAQELHNTRAVCRSSYIHPAIIDLADDAKARDRAASIVNGDIKRSGELRVNEQRLALFLAALDS